MPGRLDSARSRPAKKRPRADTGPDDSVQDDDNDDYDVDESSSRSRNGPAHRKRTRISDVDRNPPEPQDDDDDDDDDEDDAGHASRNGPGRSAPSSPPQTQFDQLRDGNFEHLEHEQDDDERATQRLATRNRPSLGEVSQVADSGIIESITCINFMCHERLHVELGPLLNFIVGENGSGKSAILTAITLCLGGKASSTNRGGSLKSFVKEGCDRAILSVKIKNQGPNAYEQDLYGDSIIVERYFGNAGGSGFKLKSETGSIVSKKRDDVDRIVEFFALQVDNPLTVLSQDNARQFLNASTKAMKYKYFVEGVQLEQLSNDYKTIQECLDLIQAKLPDQEEAVKIARKILDDLKQKKEALAGNRRIRTRMAVLRNQLSWLQVGTEEQELERRKAVLEEAKPRVDEAQRAFEAASLQYANTQNKIERVAEAAEAAETELNEATAQSAEDSAVAKMKKEALHQVLTEEREANSNWKTAKDLLKEHKAKIEDEEARLEQANGEAHSRKLQELQDAKEAFDEVTRALEEAKNSEGDLPKKLEAAKKKVAGANAEVQKKRGEIAAVEDEIKDLEKGQSGEFDGHDVNMRRLVTEIEREARFQSKPIGPLARYIQLLKPEWSDVLEAYLGQNLSGFLVTSKHDMRLLQTLMRGVGVRSPILLGSNRPLDIQGKEPDDSFDTILRALKIDNVLVRDQLILNSNIEQVVLIPDRRRAEEVIFNGGKPRNVIFGICFKRGRGGQGLRLSETNNGISTAPIKGSRGQRPRIKGDSSSRVAMKREVLERLSSEYRAIEGEHRLLQQDVKRCAAEIEKQKREIKTLETRLRHAQLKVDGIEAELDQFDGADGRLQGLKEQLPELEASVDHNGRQVGSLHVTRESQSKELDAATAKAKASKLLMKDAQARLEKAKEKLAGLQGAIRIDLLAKNEAEVHIGVCQKDVEKAEAKVQRQEAHVAGLQEEAKKKFGDRLETPENATEASMMSEYKMLNEQVAKSTGSIGMSEDDLNKALEKAQQAHSEAAAALDSSKKINSDFKKAIEMRLDRWRKFQRLISAQSRCNFVYLLAERGFRGKLVIDHRRRLLDLQIEPDNTKMRVEVRSTKTLSGGEKSYSSICLLLSIWEAMSSPLRCLDEFDVFMDNVNRAISTNMLITAARRSINRQYIFITPNAIEGRASLGRDVKVIRLTDPRQRLLADH